MDKPNTSSVLKTAALTATLAAAARLGHQIATSTLHTATLVLTLLAILGTGAATGADIRRGLRRYLSRKSGRRFRRAHGNPKDWDDDEYEAYFAITADQTPRANIRPAA